MVRQKKFVSYLRVSTERQGLSGLGLEAQRQTVEDYLNGGRWTVIKEFIETESGAKADRPQLAAAIACARAYGATLVIARLDRLSRDAHFLLGLQKAGVKFVAADMPEANEMTIGLMAVIAEGERKLIGRRTREALAAAKARGVKLGGRRPNGYVLTSEDVAKARAAKAAKASAHAETLAPIVARLDPNGSLGLRELARRLTAEGVPTVAGSATWTPAGVVRLKARLASA